MKVQTMLKRAAAVASGVLVLSATVSMNTVDSSSTAGDTTAAETSATESETERRRKVRYAGGLG